VTQDRRGDNIRIYTQLLRKPGGPCSHRADAHPCLLPRSPHGFPLLMIYDLWNGLNTVRTNAPIAGAEGLSAAALTEAREGHVQAMPG